MEIKIVGEVKFRNRVLAVYGDLDAPLFKAGLKQRTDCR